VAPHGYRHLERFRLEGTSPVWTYAVGDALLEKRVWMEPGANTTYVGYTLTRAATTLALRIKAFVNHRGYHSTSRGDGWHMDVAALPGGVRVLAFDGARPLLIVAGGTTVTPATRPEHTWYRAYGLAGERGLDWQDDHLHAMTTHATLRAGETLTLVVSADTTTRGRAVTRREEPGPRGAMTENGDYVIYAPGLFYRTASIAIRRPSIIRSISAPVTLSAGMRRMASGRGELSSRPVSSQPGCFWSSSRA
jgi:hypothetical protein